MRPFGSHSGAAWTPKVIHLPWVLLTFRYSAGFRPIRPKSAPRPPGTPLRTLPRPSQDPPGTPQDPPGPPQERSKALLGPPRTRGAKLAPITPPPSPAGGGEGGGTICPNRVRKSMKTPQGGRPTKPLNHPVLMLPGPWLQRINGGVGGGGQTLAKSETNISVDNISRNF